MPKYISHGSILLKGRQSASPVVQVAAHAGCPSLRGHVMARYNEGRSIAGACAASSNPLWQLLDAGHYRVELGHDERRRLVTWMDTYGQRLGSFDKEQEKQLRELRRRMTAMLKD